jgi:hypothetical protein
MIVNPEIMTRSAPLTNVDPVEGVADAVADCFAAVPLPLAIAIALDDTCLSTQAVLEPLETVKFPEYNNDGKSAALPWR